MHRGILHTKPGSILPVAGREASVVKMCVFFLETVINHIVGHRFGRHFVEMKPTDALHLPI